MANFIENLGLDFLTETDEKAMSLMAHIAQEGKPIVGYYGYPYFNEHFGDAQFILPTIRNDAEKRLEITGMDTHSNGNCIWEARISELSAQDDAANVMERRCVLTRAEDGSGMIVVNIVNADVLPSFAEDEFVKLQMIAFPESIDYFADEDAYAEAQPADETGKKWLLADGMVFPSGLLRNHDPDSEEFEKHSWMDDYALIRGTVKNILHGVLKFGEETCNGYIRCIIDTQYGPLEVVHTIDQVKAEQYPNIKVGAIVTGVFVLSGDAAIYEYENGLVLDESHDLSALRYTFLGGDAERMRYVFSEDAVYNADSSDKQYRGRDEIIARLKHIHDHADTKYYAHMATIVSVDDGSDPLPYTVGTRCIVLATEEETHFESIAFIEVNSEGRIFKLTTSTEGRYRFKIDEKPRRDNPLDNVKPPESVTEPILMRARYHGIIDDDCKDENVVDHIEHYRDYKSNAQRMIGAIPGGLKSAEKASLENMFGYLFAKAIEATYAEAHKRGLFKKRLLVNYSPGDAWQGKLVTLLDAAQQQKLEKAMVLGKQFYKDFSFFHSLGEDTDEAYQNDMMKALILVQKLGEMYCKKCLG